MSIEFRISELCQGCSGVKPLYKYKLCQKCYYCARRVESNLSIPKTACLRCTRIRVTYNTGLCYECTMFNEKEECSACHQYRILVDSRLCSICSL